MEQQKADAKDEPVKNAASISISTASISIASISIANILVNADIKHYIFFLTASFSKAHFHMHFFVFFLESTSL